ncbi:MAG: MFS transporter [Cyanobacteria bacterium RI_101]|nr:MFS transporter [Cyanobacteria bacterium RI_101]
MTPNALLKQTHFRRLWFGQTLIYCGAQFWFVALTWLVLQKTGSGIALGAALMAGAIPRAVLMLLGGAVSDRFHPNVVVAVSSAANTVLTGALTLLLLTNAFTLYGVVALSALSGVSEAFLYPALLTLLPHVVPKARLVQANAWMQGSEQISNILGPTMAGLAIGSVGLTAAFIFNTALFAAGAVYIYRARTSSPPIAAPLKSQTLAQSIGDGLSYAAQHPAIRASLLLIAMINFAVLGPIVVGVAELVTIRLGGSAVTFGGLQAAYGIGALAGVWIASRLEGVQRLQTPLGLLAGFLGLGLMALGFVLETWSAAIVLLLMGIGGGIVGVLALTWLQRETAMAMQGRMMGLVMFASVALDPFSQGISGALLETSLTGLFLSAGAVLLVVALMSLLSQARARKSTVRR